MFNEIRGLSGSAIAGMTMFDALHTVLLEAQRSEDLTETKRKIVLRQVAIQLKRVTERYKLDHSIDLDAFING